MRFVTGITVTAILLVGLNARAGCAPFPSNPYLGSYSHAAVHSYVEQKHGGDWSPYLNMLAQNLKRLEALNRDGRGATLRVENRPVRLSPPSLSRFVYASKQWLAIARCLSTSNTPEDLNDFTTAAAGSAVPENQDDPDIGPGHEAQQRNLQLPPLPSAVTGEVQLNSRIVALNADGSANNGQPVRVRIDARCRDGYTIFHVMNLSDGWPNSGRFSLYRLDGETAHEIGGRRLTMRKADEKVFTVSPKQNHTGTVGLAIEPSWYSRTHRMDATASCP